MSFGDSPLSLAPNVLQFIFQYGDTNNQHTCQLRLNTPADDVITPVLDGDQGGRGITSRPITRPAAEIPTQIENPNFQSQTANMRGVTNTTRELVEPMGPPLRADHPSSLETGESIGASHPSADTESGDIARKSRSKLIMALKVLLSVMVLSVIVVPGVALGVLVKQAPVGIALCGAIATVVGLFAGFYYYHSKKG